MYVLLGTFMLTVLLLTTAGRDPEQVSLAVAPGSGYGPLPHSTV